LPEVSKTRKLIELKRRQEKIRQPVSSTNSSTAAETRNRKRHAHDIYREGLKQIFPNRSSRPPLDVHKKYLLLHGNARQNTIADSISPGRLEGWREISLRNNELKTIEVSNFSFFDNPIETLNYIKDMIDTESSYLRANINFNDIRINDISPFLIMSDIWPDLVRIFSGGRISRPVKKVIESVGLRNALGMSKFKDMDQISDVWAFPLNRRIEPE